MFCQISLSLRGDEVCLECSTRNPHLHAPGYLLLNVNESQN